MRKLLTILFFAILLVGCSTPNNERQKKEGEGNVDKEKEQQVLEMQLLKADEEHGVTLDDEMYQWLAGIVEENPNIGVAGDFSVHVIDLIDTGAGESVMLFLGINHLEQPIKNITFDYTLGVEVDGTENLVFDRKKVNLSEDFAGVIQPSRAIPFTVPVTSEGIAVLQLVTEENKVVKLENPEFELKE